MSRADSDRDGFLSVSEIDRAIDRSPRRRVMGPRSTSTGAPAEVVDDLKLPSPIRERALAIVQGFTVHLEAADRVSIEIHAAMRALLDAGDYENFVAAAARLRTGRVIACGGSISAGRPPQ